MTCLKSLLERGMWKATSPSTQLCPSIFSAKSPSHGSAWPGIIWCLPQGFPGHSEHHLPLRLWQQADRALEHESLLSPWPGPCTFFLFNSWKWCEGFWAPRLSFTGVAGFILMFCCHFNSPPFLFWLPPWWNTANMIFLPHRFFFFNQSPREKRSHKDVPDYTKYHFLSRPDIIKVEEVTSFYQDLSNLAHLVDWRWHPALQPPFPTDPSICLVLCRVFM